MSAGTGERPPPEGWYPDPWSPWQLRFWDGSWTGWTAPLYGGPPPRPRPAPSRALRSAAVGGFALAVSGTVVGIMGLNGQYDPYASGNTPNPFVAHRAVLIAGAVLAGLGTLLSLVALVLLTRTHAPRRCWVFAVLGAVGPLATAVLVTAGAAAG